MQSVNVTVGQEGDFTLNPTSCAQQAVTGTLTSAQGASVGVSSPLSVEGCRSLKFAPQFTAGTQGNGTRKGNGASLDVKINYPAPYTSYANVAKVGYVAAAGAFFAFDDVAESVHGNTVRGEPGRLSAGLGDRDRDGAYPAAEAR